MKGSQPEYTAAAILVASQLGERLKARRPLGFVEIDHKPVFVQAVDHLAASKRFREIILLLHKEWVGLGTTTAEYWQLSIVRRILAGQEDPLITIERGLTALHPAYDVVAVHDGAHPLPPPELVAEVMDRAFTHGAAVPVQEVLEGEHCHEHDLIIDRDGIRYLIQSPFGFRQQVLRELLEQQRDTEPSFSDLFQLAYDFGHEPELVIHQLDNPKVDTTSDLDFCLDVIRRRVAEARGKAVT